MDYKILSYFPQAFFSSAVCFFPHDMFPYMYLLLCYCLFPSSSCLFLWSVYFFLWSLYFFLWSVYFFLWSIYFFLWSAYFFLWSVYFILWSVYFFLFVAASFLILNPFLFILLFNMTVSRDFQLNYFAWKHSTWASYEHRLKPFMPVHMGPR